MNLIVFGANGGIGIQVVEQALALGHRVTAVARRPETITFEHPCLTVTRGDVMQPPTLHQPMVGQEVVVSAIGVTQGREPTRLYSQGIRNIMEAMEQTGVRRMLCVSASGLDPGPLWQRVIAKPLLWAAFKEAYSDMVRMENAVRASTLDWTIIRPPRLSDKPCTGHYKVWLNQKMSSGFMVSRADVADYIVKHLDERATHRGMVELAY